jgi:hypothetical protein
MLMHSAPRRAIVGVAAAATAFLAAAGCGDDSTGPESPPYAPVLPSAWADSVSNPFFRLAPGTAAEFRGETDEGTETILIEILPATRVVNGVTATVVRDRVYVDGELVEDTYDWFAEDDQGNVWYLGEDSREIENGEVVSTEGSWEWGVDGALPGIIMWSDPAAHVGEDYRQEYYEDEAEDWGRVVALDREVTVPYGTFTGCVQIEEWNGLERGDHEQKYYAPGIGVVLEVGGDERVELVELTPP